MVGNDALNIGNEGSSPSFSSRAMGSSYIGNRIGFHPIKASSILAGPTKTV